MFRFFSLFIIGITLFYTIESTLANKLITGKITHSGQNTVDKNAKVEVTLQDTSLMDAPAKVIATTVITDAKTFPISYTIKYNPSDIERHRTYSLSARIESTNGKLLFINDVHTSADLSGSKSPTVDIAVIRVGQSSDDGQNKFHDKKTCAPVKCPGRPRVCPYGFQKKDGCEICRCNDPCNPPGKPILCGPGKRCFVDKKSDGTFGTRCDSTKPHRQNEGKSGKSDSKAVCNQPKLTGVCRAHMPRFYYNSAKQQCESFIYGGCGGNENNFHTKIQCEQTCKA